MSVSYLRSRLYCPLLIIAAFALAPAFARAADEANPAYTSWAKYKPGTSVKSVSETEAAGQKSKVETTTTLVDVSKEKVVIEMKMAIEVGGQKMEQPARKIEIPATGSAKPPGAVSPKAPDASAKQSDEDVTVAGKTYKCHVVEADTAYNGMKAHTKTYSSPDVPGGMVKMDSNVDNANFKAHTVVQVIEINVK